MTVTTPYRAESSWPLRVHDTRTGRYVSPDVARAWCAEHGHRWGDLWPDDAWRAAEHERYLRQLDRLVSDGELGDGSNGTVEYYEETASSLGYTLRTATVRTMARWIPATPHLRWTCMSCGLEVFKGDAETPEEALARPVDAAFLESQIRGRLGFQERRAEEVALCNGEASLRDLLKKAGCS
jgi:hypothetical protein